MQSSLLKPAGPAKPAEATPDPSAPRELKKLLAGLDFAQAAAALKPPEEDPKKDAHKDGDDDAIVEAVPESEAARLQAMPRAPTTVDPELLELVRKIVDGSDAGAEAPVEAKPKILPHAEDADEDELVQASSELALEEVVVETEAIEVESEESADETPAVAPIAPPAPLVKPMAAKATKKGPKTTTRDLGEHDAPIVSAQAKKPHAAKPKPKPAKGLLSAAKLAAALRFNRQHHKSTRVVKRIQEAVHVGKSGSFDGTTVQAIARFQKAHGLSVDGMVGKVTMGSIVAHLKREHGLKSHLTNAERGQAVFFNKKLHLHRELIIKLQKKLGVAGDGVIGPNTTNAIANYQASHKLDANGRLDPATLKALDSKAKAPKPKKPSPGSGNFSLEEFRSHDGAKTPQHAVTQLLKLIDQLEILRAELDNRSIHINSGYRSPAHNRAVGGERNSYHMKGMAADIVVAGKTPSQVHAKITKLISQGKMRQGGLGLYGSFVHYDIRGYRARW